MTVEDRATFRSVILPAETAPAVYRVGQLLNDLGHEVAPAQSPDHALDLLRQDQTDLLIVDVSNSEDNLDFVNRLSELPADSRPRDLAIFSDAMNDSLRGLRARISPSKVHIFLKPLHMHGLLGILRHLDEEN
jgi:response regulator RpfG family c-di-GMP phosphodiesterase